MQDTTASLAINIRGNCELINSANGYQAVRFERPARLVGAGTGASLAISAKGYSESVFCAGTLQVDSLALSIAALSREGDPGYNVTPVADDGDSGTWLISDSTVSLTSQGTALTLMSGVNLQNSSLTVSGQDGVTIMNGLQVSGASTVSLTASGENATALAAGELKFADFTGSFAARSIHVSSPGLAVMAGDIWFEEAGSSVSADGYDLDGTTIAAFEDASSGLPYMSFARSTGEVLMPAADVAVTPAVS